MIWANRQLSIYQGFVPAQKSLGNQGRTSIHSLTAMYSCDLRGGTADCRLLQPAVFASLRAVQGAGLACRLGRRFKAFHALRLPPATRAPLRGLCRLLRLSPFRGPYNRTPTPWPLTGNAPEDGHFFTHFSAKGGQHLLHGPPQTGADPHPTLGQGYGAARDFPFPAVSGKMKSVLRAAPRWDKVSQSRGHDLPAPTSGLLSGQRTACQRERGNCDER